MLLARANLSIYRIVLAIAYPLVRLRLLLRARKEPEYGERTEERFGHVPAEVGEGPIWFHTVSAGETIAAVVLIESMLARFPGQRVLVTTMTPTGSGEVQRRLGGRVDHCYAPYDFTRSVRRFFSAVKPKALVLMETELWPNLIDFAYRTGAPVVLVNGRLSEKSAEGYRRISGLTRDMLGKLSAVACQTPAHGERFESLGARNVQVVGSVKFDVSLSDSNRSEARSLASLWALSERRVWIGASTHEGEEEILLEAARSVLECHSDACFLLVPRHPFRAQEVSALVRERQFSVALQSELEGPAPQVVVGDVMGTQLTLFGLAEVAFVGGSLVDRGGHNPIEPALWQCPVITGPYVYNFVDIVDLFVSAGALVEVNDAMTLADQVDMWFEFEAERRKAGASGHAVVSANTGAAQRQEKILLDCLADVLP